MAPSKVLSNIASGDYLLAAIVCYGASKGNALASVISDYSIGKDNCPCYTTIERVR